MRFRNILRVRTALCAIVALFAIIPLISCQESMEEKATREAIDYTRKYCPTPIINCSRTDSITFSATSHTFTYYISFVDVLDDEEFIKEHKAELIQMLIASLRESTSMKQYIDAGCKFKYVCHSAKTPKKVLLHADI